MTEVRPIDDERIVDLCHDSYLVGSVWATRKAGITYILPVTPDQEINASDFTVFVLNDWSHAEFVNAAMLERSRHYSLRGKVTTNVVRRMKNNVEHKIVWKVFRRDNFTCQYCGDDESPMTFDHFIPESLGGATTIENGRTCCRVCNHHKGSLEPAEWLQSQALAKRKKYLLRLKRKHNEGT